MQQIGNMDPVAALNMQIMRNSMGSTDSMSSPFAQTFMPAQGQAPISNFMNQYAQPTSPQLPPGQFGLVPSSVQPQPQQQQQGNSQMQALAMLGQLLTSMTSGFPNQPNYGIPNGNSQQQVQNPYGQQQPVQTGFNQPLAYGAPQTQTQPSNQNQNLEGVLAQLLMTMNALQQQQGTQGTQQGTQGTQQGTRGIQGQVPSQGLMKTDAPMDDNECKRILAQNMKEIGGSDGKINRADVQRIAKEQPNTDLGKAMSYLDKHDDLYRSIETASQSKRGESAKADGVISLADTTTALQNTDNAEGDEAVTATLSKYSADLFPGNNGMLTHDQIVSMSKGGNMPSGKPVPEDLQLACQNLLSKKSLEMKLDSALVTQKGDNTDGAIDGKISKDDLAIEIKKSRDNQSTPELPTITGGPAVGSPIIGSPVIGGHGPSMPNSSGAILPTSFVPTQGSTTTPLSTSVDPSLPQSLQTTSNFLGSFQDALTQHMLASGMDPQMLALVQQAGSNYGQNMAQNFTLPKQTATA